MNRQGHRPLSGAKNRPSTVFGSTDQDYSIIGQLRAAFFVACREENMEKLIWRSKIKLYIVAYIVKV